MFDYKKLNIVKINLIKNRFIRKQSAYESSTSILCSHYWYYILMLKIYKDAYLWILHAYWDKKCYNNVEQ